MECGAQATWWISPDQGEAVCDACTPICAECRHPLSDCICALGEWCPICDEFECCEDTHGP